jgi:hypothetical protein
VAPSISLSTRVPRDLHERLAAEARARRVPVGTLARDLLAAGVNGEGRPPGEGGVVNEIDCLFHGLPPEAGLHREVCRSLALTVQSGGGGQVAAAKELLDLAGWAQRRFEPEDEEDVAGD